MVSSEDSKNGNGDSKNGSLEDKCKEEVEKTAAIQKPTIRLKQPPKTKQQYEQDIKERDDIIEKLQQKIDALKSGDGWHTSELDYKKLEEEKTALQTKYNNLESEHKNLQAEKVELMEGYGKLCELTDPLKAENVKLKDENKKLNELLLDDNNEFEKRIKELEAICDGSYMPKNITSNLEGCGLTNAEGSSVDDVEAYGSYRCFLKMKSLNQNIEGFYIIKISYKVGDKQIASQKVYAVRIKGNKIATELFAVPAEVPPAVDMQINSIVEYEKMKAKTETQPKTAGETTGK